jgi:hypothetical protein
MPDHAAHEIAGLKVAETSSHKGNGSDQARQPGYPERARSATGLSASFGLNGLVLYIGDTLTDFALAASVADMRQALPVLFEVPQHHYSVGANASWCMCMTMEGDMAFGCAAVPPRH